VSQELCQRVTVQCQHVLHILYVGKEPCIIEHFYCGMTVQLYTVPGYWQFVLSRTQDATFSILLLIDCVCM